MPTISEFYGIKIVMRLKGKEHGRPHIHAFYQDAECVVSIVTCDVVSGGLPKVGQRLVLEWVREHQEELLNIWHTKDFHKIPGLS